MGKENKSCLARRSQSAGEIIIYLPAVLLR
jgi:hypothetical protein